VKQKFKEALKTFRMEVYKVEHDPTELEHLTEDALAVTKDSLDNAYKYHFHKLPDASRAEVINYTLEALLPPIVEKVVKRQLLLERKLELLVGLMEEALDKIGDNDN
jgi:CRISPR/Cas system CSM-associated protein Csm2 small subunit